MENETGLRGRVLWLLMTARIHLLSPDIRRPGRVGDLIIPILDRDDHISKNGHYSLLNLTPVEVFSVQRTYALMKSRALFRYSMHLKCLSGKKEFVTVKLYFLGKTLST